MAPVNVLDRTLICDPLSERKRFLGDSPQRFGTEDAQHGRAQNPGGNAPKKEGEQNSPRRETGFSWGIPFHQRIYGRGCGEGRVRGVTLGLDAGVGVAVTVGVAVGVAVAVGVGLALPAQYLPPVFK